MRYSFAMQSLFQPTVVLALALMAVIVMMVLPMPSWMLDLGLAASFAIAILIFTITLFIERPLDFSAFPTILLASLMLRLSLNVSSTKLIIGSGHTGPDAAGQVIEGFAMFIMGGSVYLGIVIFGVIMIVNFMVITKGAGRMAEVGARFALDAMPGKQLAIDSDMAAGAIDHATARERRRIEQEETSFFGSLDGVSKFVKGDAVAGLLITMLNFIVGLAIGTLVHGMPISTAFETYSILTVGDGLVTQIPAVIISIASALLLSKGAAIGSADRALLQQLGKYPHALIAVAFMMVFFALIPGLPFIPFLAGAILVGLAGFAAARIRHIAQNASVALEKNKTKPAPPKIGDVLDLDEIHIEFAPDLIATVLDEASGLDSRIVNMRNHIASTYGLIIPEIRLTDNSTLDQGCYIIRIQGVQHGKGRLQPEKMLVLLNGPVPTDIAGTDTSEPVYGAPARWISPSLQETASLAGLSVVSPNEVVATHLLETLKHNFGRLFTRRVLRRLLDEYVSLSDTRRGDASRRIIDEFIPDKVPIETLQNVLRLLLEERVSIRNLPAILEAIAESQGSLKGPEAIVEHVRQRLGFQITSEFQEESGVLPLIQLSPEWEELFESYSIEIPNGAPDVALPPQEFNRLAASVAEKIANLVGTDRFPAIVTSTKRRKFLRTVLSAKGIRNPVLSYEEVGSAGKPSILGVA